MKLPKEYINVMITYETEVYVRDKYYGHTEIQIVTRRAFYSKSDGYYDNKNKWIDTPNGVFNVPQKWSTFTFISGESAFLPDSFAAYPRVYPKDVIKWELDQTKTN